MLIIYRFDLVVFTASMEVYGTHVADKLDKGRGILNRRCEIITFLNFIPFLVI